MLVVLLIPGLSPAQEVEVRTNDAPVWLRVDTTQVIPLVHRSVRLRLSPGVHHLEVIPAAADSWLRVHPDTTITVHAGQRMVVELFFPYIYRIETTPPGATVHFGDRLLGRTTLYRVSRHPLVGRWRVEKAGYHPVVFELTATDSLYIRRYLRLRPLRAGVQPRSWWQHPAVDYTALGVAFVGTIVSIHYKFQADRLYDRYLETGEPELKPRIRTYDRLAGWSLGVAQVGLVVFGLRLVFR